MLAAASAQAGPPEFVLSSSPAEPADYSNVYKVYIVLHGQGIRASDSSPDTGYVYTGTSSGASASNFFRVPENTKVFRMVPPGHVFMSHIDINRDLRNFFQQPLNQWIQTFQGSNNIRTSQVAAVKNQGSVDPDDQNYINSRGIFNKMFQLFETGDEITNERLETDYDTAESRAEFGIWIARPREEFPGSAVFTASDDHLINSLTGGAKEVPLQNLITQIRAKYGEDNFFEFYVANCSPVSQDFRNPNQRLVRGDNGRWSRAQDYGTGPGSKNFWLNTLLMYNKRIRLYHNGRLKLEQLKDSIPRSVRTQKRGRETAFPPNDTVWGMMDDEERQDNYKLMNGFLKFYPIWIRDASTEAEKEIIRRQMKFYIQCISTPFSEQIRDSPPGLDHIQGISQVTKDNIPIYGYKNKTTRNKKTGKRETRKVKKVITTRKVYYTLSQQLIQKIEAKIKEAQDDNKREYCRLLDYIYGQRRDEAMFAYTAGVPQRILDCEALSYGGARRKRRRKTHKKLRRKTRKKRRRKRKKTRRRKSK